MRRSPLPEVGPDIDGCDARSAIRLCGEWPAALDRLRGQDFEVAALTTDNAAVPIDCYRAKKPRVALLAGAEGPGLSASALAHADVQVTIPMTGRVDSLNVATAVAALPCTM